MIPGQQLNSLVGDFDFDLDVTCATALAQIGVLTMHAYSFHSKCVLCDQQQHLDVHLAVTWPWEGRALHHTSMCTLGKAAL
jgi:hypothetical protein